MGKKLTKKELEAKKRFHEKRARYYTNKINEEEEKKKRVGFRFYD